MVTKKDRRHDGWVSPRLVKGAKVKDAIDNALEPQDYWDDWEDYRDGFRHNKDRKLLRSRFAGFAKYVDVERWNKKLKRLIFRRKMRKLKSKGKIYIV